MQIIDNLAMHNSAIICSRRVGERVFIFWREVLYWRIELEDKLRDTCVCVCVWFEIGLVS